MPSLLPSVAAAAGEILGELRQRFMSSLPAGGRACEAETGKSHNGQDCQVARLPGCQTHNFMQYVYLQHTLTDTVTTGHFPLPQY